MCFIHSISVQFHYEYMYLSNIEGIARLDWRTEKRRGRRPAQYGYMNAILATCPSHTVCPVKIIFPRIPRCRWAAQRSEDFRRIHRSTALNHGRRYLMTICHPYTFINQLHYHSGRECARNICIAVDGHVSARAVVENDTDSPDKTDKWSVRSGVVVIVQRGDDGFWKRLWSLAANIPNPVNRIFRPIFQHSLRRQTPRRSRNSSCVFTQMIVQEEWPFRMFSRFNFFE